MTKKKTADDARKELEDRLERAARWQKQLEESRKEAQRRWKKRSE